MQSFSVTPSSGVTVYGSGDRVQEIVAFADLGVGVRAQGAGLRVYGFESQIRDGVGRRHLVEPASRGAPPSTPKLTRQMTLTRQLTRQRL